MFKNSFVTVILITLSIQKSKNPIFILKKAQKKGM